MILWIPKDLLKIVISFHIALVFFMEQTLTIPPLNNIVDSNPIHTIMGSDKYYYKRKNAELSLHLSPYFQHSATASKKEDDPTGELSKPATTSSTTSSNVISKNKVPIGNIYGNWNMFALFFNDARPNSMRGSFPALDKARSTIKSLTSALGKDFTKEANFDVDCLGCDEVGLYKSVEVEYEKTGFRAKLAFDFAFGLGISIRGGVASYKQTPKFILSDTLTKALGAAGDGDGDSSSSTGNCNFSDNNKEEAKKICADLMGTMARNTIAKELDLNLSQACRTGLEDFHIDLYWRMPFHCRDEEGNEVIFAPYVAIGAWLPGGIEKNQDKAFSLATGNDGIEALTIDTAISMEFPGMFQIGGGGGATFSSSRNICDQRVPTSVKQVGIIPWKTDICLSPGTTWYVNVSLMAQDFLPHFSFYIDWLYTEHQPDEISVRGNNRSRCQQFLPEVLEERSKWKMQHVNAGLQYNFSPMCSIGFGIQGTIHSEQAYRPTTVLGSVLFKF